MIDAVELPGVALALAAHEGAAVAADIEQRADLALAVAAEDHRTVGDAAGAEVTGVLHLRGVADINPALVEDRAVLVLQDFRRDEHLAVDRKRQILEILDDVLAVAVGVAVFVGLIEHVGLQRMTRGGGNLRFLYIYPGERSTAT